MIATVLFLAMTAGPIEAAPEDRAQLTLVACRSGHATACSGSAGRQGGSKRKQKES